MTSSAAVRKVLMPGFQTTKGDSNLLPATIRDFSTGWTVNALTLTPKYALAPDGTMTAAVYRETTAAGATHVVQLSTLVSKAASSIQYYGSLYMRILGTGDRAMGFDIVDPTGTHGATCSCDPYTAGVMRITDASIYGTAITLQNSSFSYIGHGWIFIVLLVTVASSITQVNMTPALYLSNVTAGYTGSVSNGFQLWRPRIALAADGFY